MSLYLNEIRHHGHVEEIALQPVGGVKATHVQPVEYERKKAVRVNICKLCNSIGGSNFHFAECEFCGGEVDLQNNIAKWTPIYKRVVSERKWFFGKKTIQHKEVSGKWTLIHNKG
jgi:hypothetical protein